MHFLGIDTSCYTSSIAVVDHDGKLIYDGRKLLEVKQGDRGLRQSDAFFQHCSNLPGLIAEAMEAIGNERLARIGVSSRPRDTEESYMPVFAAGLHAANIISSCTKAAVLECSHQLGHTLAGAWSINREYLNKYLVYHISGGTTELIKVDPKVGSFEIVGGTEDLNAGQYIDRIGVAMGMKFPCGQEMDKLCRQCEDMPMELPLSVKGGFLSFSGPESHVQRMLGQAHERGEAYKAKIALSVFTNIARALEKTMVNVCEASDIKDILMVGGVAANSIISSYLMSSGRIKAAGMHLQIAEPKYSSDNAVGAAVYAKRAYHNYGGLHEQF